MSNPAVNVTITGDPADLARAVKQAEAMFAQLKADAGKLSKATSGMSWGGMLQGVVAGNLVADALEGGAAAAWNFGESSIKAFASSQREWALLAGTLKNVHASFSQMEPTLQKNAAAFERLTSFDDESYASATAGIIRTTGKAAAASFRNVELVADVAVGRTIDIAAAAQLVGKAYNGNTAALHKMGIEVQAGHSALEALRQRYQGLAEAEAHTLSGQMKQTSVAWDDFKEAVGGALTAMLGGAEVFPRVTGLIRDMQHWVENNQGSFDQWGTRIGDFASGAVSVIGTLAGVVGGAIDNLELMAAKIPVLLARFNAAVAHINESSGGSLQAASNNIGDFWQRQDAHMRGAGVPEGVVNSSMLHFVEPLRMFGGAKIDTAHLADDRVAAAQAAFDRIAAQQRAGGGAGGHTANLMGALIDQLFGADEGAEATGKDHENAVRAARERVAEMVRAMELEARIGFGHLDLSKIEVPGLNGQPGTNMGAAAREAEDARKKVAGLRTELHNLAALGVSPPKGWKEMLDSYVAQANEFQAHLAEAADRLHVALNPGALAGQRKRLHAATTESTTLPIGGSIRPILFAPPSAAVMQAWAGQVAAARDRLRVAADAGNSAAMRSAQQDLDRAVHRLRDARKEFNRNLLAPNVGSDARKAGMAAVKAASDAAGVEPERTGPFAALARPVQSWKDVNGQQAAQLAAGVKDFGASLTAQFTPAGAALTAFSGFLQGIQPALDALKEPLKMLGEIVGRALIPVLQPLFPIFKEIAIAGTYLGQIIFTISGGIEKAVGALISALGRLLGHLPFIGAIGHAIERAGKQMTAQGDGFLEGAKQLAEGRHVLETMKFTDALARAGAAAGALTDSFTNIPSWYRVAEAIYSSAPPMRGPGVGAYANVGQASVINFTGDVVIHTTGDAERTYQDWRQKVIEKSRSAGGASLALANAIPA
ncbi:MAG: hypothetical protein JWM27_82 [Gemmatimonadetes bacterium]|nr:hypothetical protein [Gemmatimonadota bacterium]